VNGFGVEVRRITDFIYIGNPAMWPNDNAWPRRRDSYASSLSNGTSSTVADSKNYSHFLYERLCKFETKLINKNSKFT
jgi:hypothetical protein